jgi:heat shock protein HslJ
MIWKTESKRMKWSIISILGLLVALAGMPASPAPAADCSLVGTYWRTVAIDGTPVMVPSNPREPHLKFSADGKVNGSTGCNRLSGSYDQEGNSLHFSKMITTKMACPQLGNLEQTFLQALGATAAMQLAGKTLELQDTGGTVLMRLEAR